MNPDNQPLTEGQKQEAIKREILRKSLDRCKVLNPLDEDYTVYWDKFPHLVSSGGEAVFPRYIAIKYIKEMCDKILSFRSDDEVKRENDRRVKKGVALMDKHTEQPSFEARFAINQPELRKPVIATLWGGVVEEYGKNLPLESNQSMTATSDADLLAEIETSQPASGVSNQEDLVEEVTSE